MERHCEGRDDHFAADVLAALAAASVAGKSSADDAVERRQGRFEAFLDGFSLHCGVHLHAGDRAGIERLCRYGARSPWGASAATMTAASATA